MSNWTPLSFGKHEGKTLPQIVLTDPDWFFWAVGEGVFAKRGGKLAAEAAAVDHRARSIRIPQTGSEPLVAEYLIHQPTGKFGDLSIVPASQPLHEGGSPALRKAVIDLSVPRAVRGYDKTGCKLLLAAVKHVVFGSAAARITRERAAAFFDDDKNFM